MPEQTLLIVFIALVALALVAIAISIGIVAWRAAALLKELDSIAEDVHKAGRAAASDIEAARTRLKSGRFGFASLITLLLNARSKPRRSRKARTETQEEGEE